MKLVRTPNLSQIIIDKAKVYRQQTIGYFRQEKLTNNLSFAIVDSGWNGRLQRSLSKNLALENVYPELGTQGFYFSLDRRFKHSSKDKLVAYFSDEDRCPERRVLCHKALIELFVSANHGSTISFEYDGKQYLPVLASKCNNLALDWGINILQEAVLTFSNQLTQLIDAEEYSPADFLQVSQKTLGTFLHTPTHIESNVFGCFQFAEDQTESKFYELAPKYTWKDFLAPMKLFSRMHGSVWVSASIQRSGLIGRLLFSEFILKIKHRISK